MENVNMCVCVNKWVGGAMVDVGLLQLRVCCLGSGVAVGGGRSRSLVCLGGLSINIRFLLGFRRGIQRGFGNEGVPLILLIYWKGLLCLQIQNKITFH